MSQQTTAMPELPEPSGVITVGTQALRAFTADQMQAYALATLQAQPAAVSDEQLRAIDDAHDWTTTAGRMAAYRAILALRPQAEPFGFVNKAVAWGAGQSEMVVKITRKSQPEYGFTHAVYAAGALRPQAVPMTEQWRLLNSGDEIQAGDECLQDDCVTWLSLVGWEVGMTYNPHILVPMRRRVEAHHGITAQAKEVG